MIMSDTYSGENAYIYSSRILNFKGISSVSKLLTSSNIFLMSLDSHNVLSYRNGGKLAQKKTWCSNGIKWTRNENFQSHRVYWVKCITDIPICIYDCFKLVFVWKKAIQHILWFSIAKNSSFHASSLNNDWNMWWFRVISPDSFHIWWWNNPAFF